MKAQSARTAAVICRAQSLPGKSWTNARKKKRFAQTNTLKESGEIPLLLCKLNRNSAVPRVTEAYLAAASRRVRGSLVQYQFREHRSNCWAADHLTSCSCPVIQKKSPNLNSEKNAHGSECCLSNKAYLCLLHERKRSVIT